MTQCMVYTNILSINSNKVGLAQACPNNSCLASTHSWHPEQAVLSCKCSSLLDRHQQKGPQHCFLRVIICLPNIMQATKSPRTPPSVPAYCNWSKNGGGEGLGNEARGITKL